MHRRSAGSEAETKNDTRAARQLREGSRRSHYIIVCACLPDTICGWTPAVRSKQLRAGVFADLKGHSLALHCLAAAHARLIRPDSDALDEAAKHVECINAYVYSYHIVLGYRLQ
jgi:hypothetical protein